MISYRNPLNEKHPICFIIIIIIIITIIIIIYLFIYTSKLITFSL